MSSKTLEGFSRLFAIIAPPLLSSMVALRSALSTRPSASGWAADFVTGLWRWAGFGGTCGLGCSGGLLSELLPLTPPLLFSLGLFPHRPVRLTLVLRGPLPRSLGLLLRAGTERESAKERKREQRGTVIFQTLNNTHLATVLRMSRLSVAPANPHRISPTAPCLQ